MRSRYRAFAVGALLLATMVVALVLRHTTIGGDEAFGPADRPAPGTDENSLIAHAELVEKAQRGRIDVYFVGDSITRRWGALDYPDLLANWTALRWDDHRWAASHLEGLSNLGRLAEADLHGAPRPTRRGGSRSASDRRS